MQAVRLSLADNLRATAAHLLRHLQGVLHPLPFGYALGRLERGVGTLVRTLSGGERGDSLPGGKAGALLISCPLHGSVGTPHG